jgi:hypothetical protein
MQSRRSFMLSSGGAAALLAGSSVFLAGCPQDPWNELETWVPVAITAFDGVVAFVDSVLTAIGATVDTAWKVLEAAVNTYVHTTDPTTTLFDKVVAAIDAVETNMNSIIAALPPGLDAAILKAAQFGFALLLATLKNIQAKINPNPTPAQASIHAKTRATLASLPAVASATSTSDFIKKFNAGMQANGQALRVK